MVCTSEVKNKLIDEFWLPTATKWGNVLRPRLKKNKRFRLLTLTSDVGFSEVLRFEEGELTEKQHVVAWTHSHLKKLRLETEISPAKVFGPARYESCASSPTFPIQEHFPFDVINLDFSSQEPKFDAGRLESEISSLERTIKLQRAKGGNDFIFVYTTILNSNELDYTRIEQTSNGMPVSGWAGLPSGQFPRKIGAQKEKIVCIQTVLSGICSKYNYGCQMTKQIVPLDRENKYMLFSIALLVNGA